MNMQAKDNIHIDEARLSVALKGFFSACAGLSSKTKYADLEEKELKAYNSLGTEIAAYLCAKNNVSDTFIKFKGPFFEFAGFCHIEYSLFSLIVYSEYDVEDALIPISKKIDKLFAEAVIELTDTFENNINRDDLPTNVVDTDIFNKLKGDISQCKETKQTIAIVDCLEAKECKSLIISGRSSSGKTVAALQASVAVEKIGSRIIWLDMTSGNASNYNVVCSLLKCYGTSQRVIVVFDNAQAKPAEAAHYIGLINVLLDRFAVDFCVTVICWNQSVMLMQKILTQVLKCKPRQVNCNGYNQVNELIGLSGYEHFAEKILKDCREDVLVASSILQYLEKSGGVYPTHEQLSKSVYDNYVKDVKLSSDGIRCLYTISALGEFEIHVRKKYIEKISKSGIDDLLSDKIVRLYYDENNDVYVYLGHRSMSYIIADYLRKNHDADCGADSPEIITVNYLKMNGPKLLHSMLERLDSEVLDNDNLFIKLWQAFSNVRNYLYAEVANDAEWDDNMASMIFSAEALSDIGDFDSRSLDLWRKQAGYIRSRWRPNADHNGIEYIGGREFTVNNKTYNTTSEIIDFTENIRQTMTLDEDVNSYPTAQLAINTDFYRFRDNWLLGLLLGFEGKARDEIGIENSEAYVDCARKMQLNSGAFYPERVSWVTARVIMGLSQCGYDYRNSSIVKRACDWLLSRFSDKISTTVWQNGQSFELEFSCGGWSSGTGSWNSDIQITLMNLCALFGANCTKFDDRIRGTINYIKFNAIRLAQTLPNPLDIIWVVSVMSYINEDLISLDSAINKLSDETLAIWDDAHKNAYEKQKESSNVPFAAKELLNIMWSLVRNNIKNLLSGLEPVLDNGHIKGKDIFISYRRVEGAGRLYAETLYDGLDAKYHNDVFYDMKDLQSACSDFNEILDNAINNAKAVIVIVTDNAFKRCLNEGYNLKDDVYLNEIKAAFDYGKNVIAIYNDKPHVPEELKSNTECYNLALKLSQLNAVVFQSQIDSAREKLFKDVFAKLDPILINP